MTKPVKKRSYSSAVRQEQAARTRTRIVEAAGALFEANGYARTTIREIAEQADVASDTVYAVFGSKARVLTALIDARLAPGADVANVMDRPEARAVRDEPDQHRQVHLFARDMATTASRVRGVFEILRTA
ncbi:MAG TPA: helix-turn-helix domain-containing protein, partial [Ilumatobacteraceae bacterium]|nr:helix-turn-helix domain-containing protein [Ilumatobacteraceae bacterium]